MTKCGINTSCVNSLDLSCETRTSLCNRFLADFEPIWAKEMPEPFDYSKAGESKVTLKIHMQQPFLGYLSEHTHTHSIFWSRWHWHWSNLVDPAAWPKPGSLSQGMERRHPYFRYFQKPYDHQRPKQNSGNQLSDPTKITPYRETGVAIPLSHCVPCGIADYRGYIPLLSVTMADHPNTDLTRGVSQKKLASEAYRATRGVARNSIANRAQVLLRTQKTHATT